MNAELTPDVKEEIVKVESDALALVITSNETYSNAGELLKLNKGLEKKIKSYFKPLKEHAHKAWKVICSAENTEVDKLQPAIKHLNGEMTKWNIEQEKIRKAEEDRLRREAEAQAEEERLQAAIEAEKSGNNEEAEEILEEPVYVPPPIVEKSVPKVDGQTMTTTWKWRLTSIEKVPRQYLTINETAVNGIVRALKDKANVPGITVYPEHKMRGVRS